MTTEFALGYGLATTVALIWAHFYKAKPKLRRYVVTGFWQAEDSDKRHYAAKDFTILRGDIALVIQSWVDSICKAEGFGYTPADFVLTGIAEVPVKDGTKYEH